MTNPIDHLKNRIRDLKDQLDVMTDPDTEQKLCEDTIQKRIVTHYHAQVNLDNLNIIEAANLLNQLAEQYPNAQVKKITGYEEDIINKQKIHKGTFWLVTKGPIPEDRAAEIVKEQMEQYFWNHNQIAKKLLKAEEELQDCLKQLQEV